MNINFRDLSRYFLIVAGVVLFIGIFVNATVFSKSQLGPDQNRTIELIQDRYALAETTASVEVSSARSEPTTVVCNIGLLTNQVAMVNGEFEFILRANCTGDGTLMTYRIEVQSSSVEDQNGYTTLPSNDAVFTGQLEPVTLSAVASLPQLQGFQYYATATRNLRNILPPSSMISAIGSFGLLNLPITTLAWAINDDRDSYPIIRPENYFEVPDSPDLPGGYVPFPKPPIQDCKNPQRRNFVFGCPYRPMPLNVFAGRIIHYYQKKNWPVPPPTSRSPHHILPVACGGDSNGSNGVLLTPQEHGRIHLWWNKFNQSICPARTPAFN